MPPSAAWLSRRPGAGIGAEGGSSACWGGAAGVDARPLLAATAPMLSLAAERGGSACWGGVGRRGCPAASSSDSSHAVAGGRVRGFGLLRWGRPAWMPARF
ncbi:MAG: hypothetical protein GXP39_04505 [Chloroflexi bacterium]|nr:hypothetical protein [Chloroflexota bacterium]